ncbi:MAG: ABC transporter permease subunit [Achromobacter pestifer]
MTSASLSGRRGVVRLLLSSWLAPVALLALWQLASASGWLNATWLPAPSAVWSAAAASAGSGELWPQLQVSLWRAAVALVLGMSLGLASGFAFGLSHSAGPVLDAGVRMLRGVAVLALIAFLLLGPDIQEDGRLALLSAAVFFPVYQAARQGVRAVDPKLIEMGRSVGLTGGPLWRDVILPGALPAVLSGTRTAVALLWVLLLVVETVAAPSGIGHLARQPDNGLPPAASIFFGVLLVALLASATDALIRALTRRTLRWDAASRPAGAY